MSASDQVGETRSSRATRESALTSLLEANPGAWVVAVASGGRFTDMPADFPLAGHHTIKGAVSGLDLVAPQDRTLVIETWARAVAEGIAHALVHPKDGPHRQIDMHIFDVTERYGVYIGVFLGFSTEEIVLPAHPPELTPRMTLMRKDHVGLIVEVDEAATAILGWRADELLGRRVLDFLHPDDAERVIAGWMAMLVRPGSSQRVRARHRHKNGSWVWLEVTNHNHLDDAVDPHVLSDAIDVTEEVHALEALRANEQLLGQVIEAMPVGVLYVGALGEIDYANGRLGAIVGVSRATTVADQFAHAVDGDREALLAAVKAGLRRGRDSHVQVAFAARPGADRSEARSHCDVNVCTLRNEAGAVIGAVVCVTDQTEDVTLREELREQARYDLPTGVLNHASVMAALADRVPPPAGERIVVAFVDIDDFKGVNDRYGHAVGDVVLRHVAERLCRLVRDGDTVGRLGGDEFLIVMRTADDPAVVAKVSRRVSRATNRAIPCDGGEIPLRASIGIASAGAGSTATADNLVSAADEAMYESKRRGTPVAAER